MMPSRCAVAAACIFATSAVWAQSSAVQKAGAAQGAATAQKPINSSSQQSSGSQQDCGKPNAQGVTVLCPGNKAAGNATNPLAKPSGTGIGTASGVPSPNPLGTGSNSSRGSGAQPTSEELARKLKEENSRKSEGKSREVGPEHFSREQQLKDLATGTRGVAAPTGPAGQQGSRGSGMLGDTTPTPGTVTVGRDAGKNDVSKREQQSDWSPPPVQGRGELLRRDEQRMQAAERQRKTQDHLNATKDAPSQERSAVGEAVGKAWAEFQGTLRGTPLEKKHPEPTASAGGPRGRPAPDSAGGDGGPLPKAISGGDPGKSPEQMERERKRQVTLPSENQPRATERVTFSAETARQLGAGGNTSGNITPADGDGTSNTPGTKPTRGLEKVDGTPGGGGAGTGPSKTGQ